MLIKFSAFSSVFQLVIAYYFAFINTSSLWTVNAPSYRHLASILESLINEMNDCAKLLKLNNDNIDRKTNDRTFLDIIELLGSLVYGKTYGIIKNKCDTQSKKLEIIIANEYKEKIQKKYNPIYVFFGLYSLTILIMCGVADAFIDNSDSYICLTKQYNHLFLNDFEGTKFAKNILQSIVIYLNVFSFLFFQIIFITQKVDRRKHNETPSWFYQPSPYYKSIFIFVIILIISYKLGYYKSVVNYRENYVITSSIFLSFLPILYLYGYPVYDFFLKFILYRMMLWSITGINKRLNKKLLNNEDRYFN